MMRDRFPTDIVETVDAILNGVQLDCNSDASHYGLWETIAQALLDERMDWQEPPALTEEYKTAEAKRIHEMLNLGYAIATEDVGSFKTQTLPEDYIIYDAAKIRKR